MIIIINNNQLKVLKDGLMVIRNTKIINQNIVIAKVLTFKCDNDIVHNSLTAKWLAIGKVIGSQVSTKYFCRKFKCRKGYVRRKNYRIIITLIHFVKVIPIANYGS